ncbi:MAG: NosD domain-containing protein, partial [Polaromonas sp.]
MLLHWLVKIALLAGCLGVSVSAAWSAVLLVKPGESIAAMIQAAQPGDTVQVARGFYAEKLMIDKPLTLQGLDRPTISAQGTGHVIRVHSPDVRIEGFILRDSGVDLGAKNAGVYVEPGSDRVLVRDCALVYNLFGVWLEQSKDARVIANVITGKRDLMSAARGNGIQVFNMNGVQILDNNISFTRDGIYVDVSSNALFRGNKIHHLRYG